MKTLTPSKPAGVDNLDKVTQERLAQANGRLRAGNVGVVIRHRGLKLYLRAMLPPKPGSPHDKPHQQEIAIGARANPAGVSVAEKEARKVGSLIENKEFSWLPYLKKYHLPELENAESDKPTVPTLDLWDRYVSYKAPSVEVTTIRSTYSNTRCKLVKFGHTISDRLGAIEFRDFCFVDGCKPVTARKYLVQLNACYEWAMECGLVDYNPFSGLAKQLKVRSESKPDPFTREEAQAILEAFRIHKRYGYYYPYVKFLFLTGARPEDAVGLQWKHINLKTGVIKFEEAVNTGFNIRKAPKNHQSRIFPINDLLRQLLESIKPRDFQPEDPVFKSKEGQQLNHSNFLRRAWKGYTNRHKTLVPGIVTKLVEEGKVSHYREPYAMRDTFISHCIERKDATYRQVSEWVGNKPEVIHRHYAGKVETVSVPDLGF